MLESGNQKLHESSNPLDSLRLLHDELQTKLQQVQDTLQQAELKQANNNSTNSTSSKKHSQHHIQQINGKKHFNMNNVTLVTG
jgi:exonuclease VII small subunit